MIKGKRKRAHSVHLRVGRSKETARIKLSRYPKAHDGGEVRAATVSRYLVPADFRALSKARDKRARRQVRNLRVSGMGAIDG